MPSTPLGQEASASLPFFELAPELVALGLFALLVREGLDLGHGQLALDLGHGLLGLGPEGRFAVPADLVAALRPASRIRRVALGTLPVRLLPCFHTRAPLEDEDLDVQAGFPELLDARPAEPLAGERLALLAKYGRLAAEAIVGHTRETKDPSLSLGLLRNCSLVVHKFLSTGTINHPRLSESG